MSLFWFVSIFYSPIFPPFFQASCFPVLFAAIIIFFTIYLWDPPFPYNATPLCSLPLSFRMCLLFPSFILPVLLCLYFIPVYATYIVPLPLYCSHYFHSTACTTPHPLLPFCSHFLAMTVVSTIPWNSTPFFLSHIVSLLYFVFIVIPFIPFMPFCYSFLFGITCTTLLPFLSFIFIIPLTNAASPRTKLHKFLYHFSLSSTLYLLLPFFFYLIINILSLMPPLPLSFSPVPSLSFIC